MQRYESGQSTSNMYYLVDEKIHFLFLIPLRFDACENQLTAKPPKNTAIILALKCSEQFPKILLVSE